MVFTLIMIDGGSFAAYFDAHAVIVIFGGSVMATIIRFPFSTIASFLTIAHAVPMGPRHAFMRAVKPHDLIAKIAETVRESGPMALKNMEISDPFPARGARCIADGYDRESIADLVTRPIAEAPPVPMMKGIPWRRPSYEIRLIPTVMADFDVAQMPRGLADPAPASIERMRDHTVSG